MLKDSFGRSIEYLRLSVTDRCNLRCAYCLPEGSSRFAGRGDLLSDAEIETLVASFVKLGVSHVRVTGGEPLTRPGLEGLIRRLAALGLAEISLSTNGVLLAERARELKEAGLARVNVSLDSLDAGRFKSITRFGNLPGVLAGLRAALDAGLNPVKVNMVVARGFNEDEIGAFARLSEALPVHVRFIELMPMGETGFFSKERFVGLEEIMRAAGPLTSLGPGERPAGLGPARYFRRPRAPGTLGFISALSCGFCSSCNRVRLSATGKLVACLDGTDGVDLGAALRGGSGAGRGGPEEIERLIREAVRAKPQSHHMLERAQGATRFMCQIGG